MNPGVRVIRFARAEDGHRLEPSGPVTVARVLLQEEPNPAGHIVRQDSAWLYLLADGSPSGLSSTLSRQDLEQQIVLFHFGPLPVMQPECAEPPLQIAV